MRCFSSPRSSRTATDGRPHSGALLQRNPLRQAAGTHVVPLRLLGGLSLIALMLSGCTAQQSRSSATATGTETTAGSTTDSVVRQCSAAETEATVIRFVEAINAGQVVTADAIVGTGVHFKWFSRPGRGDSARVRETLPAALEEMGQEGSRSLEEFRYAGNGNFSFVMALISAAGERRQIIGKGMVACATGQIAVWSEDFCGTINCTLGLEPGS